MATSLKYLLENLEDPFCFFPVESVSRSLRQLVEDADEAVLLRMGPSGVARKYWDVPTELLHEERGLLIGAGFVLGQAMITQSLSIIKKIRVLAPTTTALPNEKAQILAFHASIDRKSGISHPCIVDLAANYFKHYPEWPEGWITPAGSSLQARTIEGCITIGMSPNSEVTDNMFTALHRLGSSDGGAEAIQACIKSWREKLARHLYAALGISDPNLAPCEE